MKIRAFLSSVPKSFKWAAFGLAVCSLAAGTTATLVTMIEHGIVPGTAAAGEAAMPFGAGIAAAVLGSIWVIFLGYVNADARQRSMPAWLWTLIAAFIPNLLGFLLYFACRRPISVPCPHCGQANTPGHRFCSWCGQLAAGPLASEGKLA
jgi:hypothetical protein